MSGVGATEWIEMLREKYRRRPVRTVARVVLLGPWVAAREIVEPSRVVGRCKYAACGHRLGQAASLHGGGE